MRINKYIAASGYASRRKADELVASGKVRVNDVPVTELGAQVDPDRDRVTVEGKALHLTQQHRYYKYHKRRGEISSHRAQGDSPTVFRSMRRQGVDTRGLKLIGRLDKDSEGLMLFTTDNRLVDAVAHPRRKVRKVYRVTLLGQLLPPEIAKARRGIKDDGEKLAVGDLRILSFKNGVTETECILHEGKKRHLRRLFRQLHKYVRKLKRTAIGEITLGPLEPGLVKPLTEAELKFIRNLAG